MKEDKTLTCCECGAEFVFTASEQEFYEEKGFTNEPRRCPACRQARKQRMGIATERPQRETAVNASTLVKANKYINAKA